MHNSLRLLLAAALLLVAAVAPRDARAGNCNKCAAGQTCYNNACCTLRSCAAAGATCGSVSDNCGGMLSCGTCPGTQTCSGNVCVCTPKTCAQLGAVCGSASDGCGNTLTCGSCVAGKSCQNNQCVSNSCTPKSCAQLGITCGSASDGCGNTLTCGTCANNAVCTNGSCKCTPTTCAAQNRTCGSIPDGCGGSLNCGPACGLCQNATGSAFDPVGVTTQFGPGSLVIPMDACNNPDTSGNTGPTNVAGTCSPAAPVLPCYANYTAGNVRLPFGLIYLLAYNNIPVYVALNQQKVGLADADFSVTPPLGAVSPTAQNLTYANGAYLVDAGLTTGTNTQYYHGMPFIVDAAYAQQALQVLANFNQNNSGALSAVHIHVVNYPFNAPIITVLASRPNPVGIEGAGPLPTFFDESGISSVVPGGSTSTYVTISGGGNAFQFTWPSAQLGANPLCPGDVCSALTGGAPTKRVIDTIWTDTGDLKNWTQMSSFFTNGGIMLGIGCASLFESGNTVGALDVNNLVTNASGAQHGSYCTAVGQSGAANVLNDPGYVDATAQYPASDRFLQLDTYQMFVHGSGGGDGSSYDFNAAPAPSTHVLSDGSGAEVISGHAVINNTQVPGAIVYLGSLNSWHGGSSNKDGGLHIMYNSLLAGTDGQCGPKQPMRIVELTRSSAVETLIPNANNVLQFRIYQGTFDWYVPADATAMGEHLFQPDPKNYPYVTGHLREFKPAGSYTVGASTTYTACSATDPNSACNWDAASSLPVFAQRRIYVATGSTGNYTLQTATSLAGSDATINYIASHLDVIDNNGNHTGGLLGGVDYSTPAVVEGKSNGLVTVAGAQGRPTIAYVGARDGMLHAFCVKPGPGHTQCYDLYDPGQEIWAIITPATKALMDAAYTNANGMDWSNVSMGASLRVADIKDNFEPNSRAGGEAATGPVYRTVLIVGTRQGGGSLAAIDISNPNPANINQAGFMLMWEQDGTRTINGATAYKMGGTNGATISQTLSGDVVAIATSSTCMGLAGCPLNTTAGINTYLLQLSDGAVVSSNQKLYTRKSLLLNVPITNDVPPMPTTLDDDQNGTDEEVFVPDLEGYVRRFTVTTQTTPSSFDLNKLYTVFDASSGCANGVSCQPVSTSPTIVRTVNGTPAFGVIVASGGADWARTPSSTQGYNVYAFDAGATSITAPYFSDSLGAQTPPVSSAGGAANAPGAQPVPYALRAYAQLTVAGSDLYADVTTLAVGSIYQLAQPLITPGPFGAVKKWPNINNNPATGTSIAVIGTPTAYAGGLGSVLVGNTGPTDGVLFMPDSTGPSKISVQTLASNSSSLSNASYAIVKGTSTNRPFNVLGWFDSSN